jgi:glycerol-3-phosphate acyltransferase PlsY
MSINLIIVAALVGYVLGSLPFGYLVARAHGVDIFTVGSGNPGATNVKRALGARAGNMVFALDVLKGAFATGWPWLYGWVSMRGHPHAPPQFYEESHQVAVWMMVAGLVGAVLGHSFSMFTRFKGGKGVATAAGGLVVLLPVACLAAGAMWVAAFYAFRYVSLASILAAATVAVVPWFGRGPLVMNLVATGLGVFVIVRHRANIQRLLNGTESRFVKKPAETISK